MKEITMFQTLDGMNHASKEEAEKHLDKILAELLTKPAQALTGKKYPEVVKYLSDPQNLQIFSKAYSILKDIDITD